MANTILPGYIMPLGDKYLICFDHTGPSSYAQFSSPTTGGDKINASDIGMGGFDTMQPVVDTTGLVIAYPVFNYGGNGNAVPSVVMQYWSLVTATIGGQSQTLGTQIAASTDLSALKFRVKAICV